LQFLLSGIAPGGHHLPFLLLKLTQHQIKIYRGENRHVHDINGRHGGFPCECIVRQRLDALKSIGAIYKNCLLLALITSKGQLLRNFYNGIKVLTQQFFSIDHDIFAISAVSSGFSWLKNLKSMFPKSND